MGERRSASSFKPRCKARAVPAALSIRIFAILICVLGLAACKHVGATVLGGTVLVVDAPPAYCKKLGVVQGFGGGARYAVADARTRALERGATHMVLGTPDLDVETGITTVVDATLFDCPPPGSVFPPIGYP
jgi:hypothetical protein